LLTGKLHELVNRERVGRHEFIIDFLRLDLRQELGRGTFRTPEGSSAHGATLSFWPAAMLTNGRTGVVARVGRQIDDATDETRGEEVRTQVRPNATLLRMQETGLPA
jgi:hypothetical protein